VQAGLTPEGVKRTALQMMFWVFVIKADSKEIAN
jgi:hypothetical protein